MTEPIEDQLRRALRPVDAPQGFAERVLAALPERRATVTPLSITTRVGTAPPARRRRNFFLPAALAASLLCAVFLGQHSARQRAVRADAIAEQRGREASRELMQALRITNQKLDIASEAMNQPRADSAEENRT